ncbi:MAG: RDD family protein [Bryobacteraceae bacterium]
MHCPNCGTLVQTGAAFCPNCGTGLNATAIPEHGSPSGSSSQFPTNISPVPAILSQPEERVRRVVAYLIDVVPMLLLAFIHFLPVIGWMFYGLIHACYWLFRDINGASLGKLVMGSFVASENGTPASTKQRILRNVTLALPGVVGTVPLLGLFFEAGLAIVIFGAEAILLLVTGRRLGDRIAGTMVFRRTR